VTARIDVDSPTALALPTGDILERRLVRTDGRTLAWAEVGSDGGQPILRIPGTPSSRFMIRADTLWTDRGLRMIITERPGMGASTPLARRGFLDHADDLVAILDELGLERVPVIGFSGGGPYALALAAAHPDRVQALSVVVGAAPITDEEADLMIGLNAEGYRLAKAGNRDGLVRLLAPQREAMLKDPLAGFRTAMTTAPASDQAIMADPGWQAMLTRNLREALKQGVDGWVDESSLMFAGWQALEVAAVVASVTWWHGEHDRNVPFAAAERLIARLPNARLVRMTDAGHLAPYLHEGDILDELAARAALS
jgi:pimeloyl-ACP methyl ester carboxylesterase